MKSQSKVVLVQRATCKEVLIYYSKNGLKFRVSTKVKIPNSTGNFEEALNKNQEKIKKLHLQVELLIDSYWKQYHEHPSTTWLKAEFEKSKLKKQTITDAPISHMLLDDIENEGLELVSSEEILSKGASIQENILFYWGDFIQFKALISRNIDTIKRYNNLATTLVKFWEKYCDYGYDQLGLREINIYFFINFLRYMIKEHEFTHTAYTAYPETPNLPQIGITNTTAIKRLTDFIEYLKFLKRKKDIQIDIEDMRDCMNMAKHKLHVTKEADETKWELTLTIEELQFIVNLQKYEPEYYKTLSPAYRRYLAIFIFMCLQGTSPVDTKKINRTSIMNGNLVGKRSKTKIGFKVELDAISEMILKEYDYNLDFTEQSFNEVIKKMMVTIFELYRPRFEEKYDEQYELIYVQKKFKGDEEVNTIRQKGLYAEAMTGRRTFITNLNEDSGESNLKENMRRTGHTQIQTHLGYQKDRQTGKMKKRNLFGIYIEPLQGEVKVDPATRKWRKSSD